jgi:spore maturation protein CgeB
MRVLLVTGQFGYGDPKRGEGYEHQNFIPALRRLGHDVEVLDSLLRCNHANFIELNRALLKRVEDWKPDVIFHTQVRYEIWTETWEIIRKSENAATVNWASDDSWKYWQASRFLAKHFDACVTTYRDKVAQYRRDGCDGVVESQWAADATRLAEPLSAAECAYDVSFIGACYGTRARFIRALERAGVKVTCLGYGWPAGPISGDQIAPILRSSRVTLNFSGSGRLIERVRPNRRQIKARVFEVPGAGGFLLSEWAPGLDRLYAIGKEIDVFRTESELVERVKYYLEHPEQRDECARAGYHRTMRDHTYDLRMRELVEFAVEQHGKAPRGTGAIDWAAFEEAASRHRITIPLVLLRKALVAPCSLLFGAGRGARAARRLLFEFSWRVLGEMTYSSRGIPGRLFYDES